MKLYREQLNVEVSTNRKKKMFVFMLIKMLYRNNSKTTPAIKFLLIYYFVCGRSGAFQKERVRWDNDTYLFLHSFITTINNYN